jgi:O-antigen biosynthesis protein
LSNIKYQGLVDITQKNNSHTIAYEFIESLGKNNLKILEVGCSSGYFGEFLKYKGHTVWGVEPSPDSSRVASTKLDLVFSGFFEDFIKLYPEEKFDVLVFGDVLEHIPDPSLVLAYCHDMLNNQGIIVASVPNVTHIAIRAMLLDARWEYSELGIMDQTHLRFFTRKTIQELFYKSNFLVKDIKSVTVPVDMVANMTRIGLNQSNIDCIDQLSNDDTKLDFQYVLKVSKNNTKNRVIDDQDKIKVLGLAADITSSHAEVRLINPLKAWEVLGEGVVKLNNLADCPEELISWADVVVIQRHVDLHTLRALKLATKYKKKIIYETDDFLLQLPDHLAHHRIGLLSYREHLEFLLPQVDCITATTDRLANQFKLYNRPTIVIPNCSTNDDLPAVKQDDWKNGKATLIVASTDSVLVDFILPAISVILNRKNIQVEVVVIGPPGNVFDEHDITCTRVANMSYLEFKKFIRTIDNPIGIIPLDESLFSSCKTAVKYFDYTMAGIPVICSNVPPYSDVIRNGVNGLLSINYIDDWVKAILTFVNSVEQRKVMVASAQKMVLGEFSQDRVAREWDILLKDLQRNRYQFSPPIYSDSFKKIRLNYIAKNLLSLNAYRAAYRIIKLQGHKAFIRRFFPN